jgi:N-formylglutamate amidohydrolase
MPSYPAGVVLHIPHNSKVIPPEVRDQFALDDRELRREVVRMTDHRTLDLFAGADLTMPVVAARVSRLVVDVERFLEDAQEPMATLGMGAIYTRASGGAPLRRQLDAAEREALLERHYRPHHRLLLEATNASLAAHGRCLILDGHSFPPAPLPYERDRDPERPEICIGTDAFHTPDRVREAFIAAFRHAGFTVSCDRPFAGALVPLAHYRRDPRVMAVMVEINRDLYLKRDSDMPRRCFRHLARRIRSACCEASWMVMR